MVIQAKIALAAASRNNKEIKVYSEVASRVDGPWRASSSSFPKRISKDDEC